MITLQRICVQPNHHLNFSRPTLLSWMSPLVMYMMCMIYTNPVICYSWKGPRDRKPRTLSTAILCIRGGWWWFAPIVANSLGLWGPHCLKTLWLREHHSAQTQYGFSLGDVNNNCLNEHVIDSHQAIDYWRVRGGKYHENSLCLLTCTFEAINKRILGDKLVLPVS